MDKRLDVALVERGMVKSRTQAQELIDKAQILVDGKPVFKASHKVADSSLIKIQGETLRYVGRGGLKLEKALQVFQISLQGKICADIGASTGGFTDCMLQSGAQRVYAIDAGHDQLDARLKADVRVINLERQNIRTMEPSLMPEAADFAAVDVSFISLKLVIPQILTLLDSHGELVALIKPQFEAGKNQVGKNGIIKSIKVHQQVLTDLIDYFNAIISVKAIDFSPILGGEGNIEYLLYASKQSAHAVCEPRKVIQMAFDQLKGGITN